jgi:hypothetical protein
MTTANDVMSLGVVTSAASVAAALNANITGKARGDV